MTVTKRILPRKVAAQAAGTVTDLGQMDSPRPDNARTARSHPADGPEHPPELESPSIGVCTTQTSEAA